MTRSSWEDPGGKLLSREEVRMAWTEKVTMTMGATKKTHGMFWR